MGMLAGRIGGMPEERLQKLLARGGYGSRRSCEQIITQGRVTVNGNVAQLGQQADPQKDDIRVDGQRLALPESFVYIMLNKPRGVISDEDVGGNWPPARDLIPLDGHLYPVGRLDVQSEGLMLFTDDGQLAHRLTHPRYEHTKTYHVLVEGRPPEQILDRWRHGVNLDGKATNPAGVRVLRKTREGTWIEVIMSEGRKRQIRRVAARLGHPALQVKRVKIGPLELGDLPSGAWRRLTDEEVATLQTIRNAPEPRRRKPGKSSRPGSPNQRKQGKPHYKKKRGRRSQ
jgi:23S rRNA pseudouridine2605 synthase